MSSEKPESECAQCGKTGTDKFGPIAPGWCGKEYATPETFGEYVCGACYKADIFDPKLISARKEFARRMRLKSDKSRFALAFEDIE